MPGGGHGPQQRDGDPGQAHRHRTLLADDHGDAVGEHRDQAHQHPGIHRARARQPQQEQALVGDDTEHGEPQQAPPQRARRPGRAAVDREGEQPEDERAEADAPGRDRERGEATIRVHGHAPEDREHAEQQLDRHQGQVSARLRAPLGGGPAGHGSRGRCSCGRDLGGDSSHEESVPLGRGDRPQGQVGGRRARAWNRCSSERDARPLRFI